VGPGQVAGEVEDADARERLAHVPAWIVLIVALTVSNSLRRSSMSSGVSFEVLEYSGFQSASSRHRSGDCTVVRGPGADSSTRSASSSVRACDSVSNGLPAELPSGKSL